MKSGFQTIKKLKINGELLSRNIFNSGGFEWQEKRQKK